MSFCTLSPLNPLSSVRHLSPLSPLSPLCHLCILCPLSHLSCLSVWKLFQIARNISIESESVRKFSRVSRNCQLLETFQSVSGKFLGYPEIFLCVSKHPECLETFIRLQILFAFFKFQHKKIPDNKTFHQAMLGCLGSFSDPVLTQIIYFLRFYYSSPKRLKSKEGSSC